jgi:hypothetical protein
MTLKMKAVTPKRRQIFTKLYGIISKKTEAVMEIDENVATWAPTPREAALLTG